MKTHALTTLTYGTGPAPYVAQKHLQTIAEEVKDEYPETAETIVSNFYMEDELSGDDDDKKAIQKAMLVRNTLLKAHFQLRKYVSNSRALLNVIDPTLVELLHPASILSTDAVKILSLQ